MLNYSPRAAKAMAQLKRHYNDVDVFVEDTANHNMWLLIIRSLLPTGMHIESVNMLGGRNAVTRACELDQKNTGRKKIYIIDGDLDFLLGKRMKRLKYLYRIRANNIENILINEEALVSMALEHQPKKNEITLRSEISFAESENMIRDALIPLFIAYAVTQKLSPTTQTTSFSVRKLISNTPSGPKIDKKKVGSRIFSLYLNLARNFGVERVKSERAKVHKRSEKLKISQIVSGKDYVLPLIMLQFQARCGYGRNDESFKVALARSWSRDSEPYFARKMKTLAA